MKKLSPRSNLPFLLQVILPLCDLVNSNHLTQISVRLLYWARVSKSFFSPKSLIARLQGILKCAARLVVGAPPDLHITPIHRHFHWLSVKARISYKTAHTLFQRHHCHHPYLPLTFCSCSLPPHLFVRSSANIRLLKVPVLEVQDERWTCCLGIRSFLLELTPYSHEKCYNNRYFKARFENQSLNLLEYDQLFPGLVW